MQHTFAGECLRWLVVVGAWTLMAAGLLDVFVFHLSPRGSIEPLIIILAATVLGLIALVDAC